MWPVAFVWRCEPCNKCMGIWEKREKAPSKLRGKGYQSAKPQSDRAEKPEHRFQLSDDVKMQSQIWCLRNLFTRSHVSAWPVRLLFAALPPYRRNPTCTGSVLRWKIRSILIPRSSVAYASECAQLLLQYVAYPQGNTHTTSLALHSLHIHL